MKYWIWVVLVSLFNPKIVYVQNDWNGKPCAFTFSTDDGYHCNLDWKIIFDRFGYHFTIFVNPLCGGLGAGDLNTLNDAGHEIASHSMAHQHLIKNTAFTVQYMGDADSSSIKILDDTLYLYSSQNEDYRIVLTDSFYEYLVDIVNYIDSLPSYSCILDYYPDRYWQCKSMYLVEIDWQGIKSSSYQVLTENGSNMQELLYEVCDSKQWLDSVITDPLYECKTFAYPCDEHDLREMIVVRDSAGYIAARNGGRSRERPWGCKGAGLTWDTVSLYEMPLKLGVAFMCGNNLYTEEQTRETTREYIAEWKTNNLWAISCTHNTNGVDTLHLSWILDEIRKDGDVWIETFGKIAEYVRQTHHTDDGWNWVSNAIIEENTNTNLSTNKQNTKIEIFPNPSTKEVIIRYSLNKTKKDFRVNNFRLTIYDIVGRLIWEFQIPDSRITINEVVWDGRNKEGKKVQTGIYFCKLSGLFSSTTKKFELVK